jgi:hypothetical protein
MDKAKEFAPLHSGQFFVYDEDIDLGKGLDEVDRLDPAGRSVYGKGLLQALLEFFKKRAISIDDEDHGSVSRFHLFFVRLSHV